MNVAQEPQDDAGSAWGSQGAKIRWGATKVIRAAETVITRASELPDDLREQLHQVTGETAGDGDA